MMDNRKGVIRGMMMITQLGLGIIAPVFMCAFIGYFLDSRFGLNSMFWMLMLGFLAGGRNGWVLVLHALRKDEEERKHGSKNGNDPAEQHRR